MNPSLDTDRERLSKALCYSYESLAAFRRPRRQLIEDFAGPRYGVDEYTLKPETYVNLMQIAVDAYLVNLAYHDPRFIITSTRAEQQSFAARFQVALNTYAKKIHLGDTVREIVRDAVFMVGIGKLHLEDSAVVQCEEDVWGDPGMPFFSRVSLDNWVHDVTKSEFRFAQFFGDRFSMDLSVAKECPYFTKSVREKLEATTRSERDLSQMASGITQESNQTETEIDDVVDLVNIYLPRERKVCTWAVRDDFELLGTPPLAVLDWDGPETGPYRFLSFLDIPDNIMPSSPAQALGPLFHLFNFLMRKIARRSKQQKDVIAYDAGSEHDVSRAMMSEDMSTVRVTHMKGIDVMKFPGPDQSIVQFTYGLQEIFKQAAGNIDAMVGLAPTASTLGQSQLIDQKVGVKIAEARRKVNRFVTEVGTDLGWMLFDDPMQVIPGEREIPGTDYSIDASWAPPDILPRDGAFSDFGIECDAESMVQRTSGERLGTIMQGIQALMPLMPAMQQQGYEFQPQEFLKDFADLSNEPRIARYFRQAVPPMGMEQPQQKMGAVRPPGTGQYTRTNVSEKTGSGQLEALMTQQPTEQPAGMMGG